MNLQNFINNGEIEEIGVSASDAKKKLAKAFNILRSVQKIIDMIPPEVIFTNVYDAARISCSSLLSLKGYRVKKSGSKQHFVTFASASDLLGTEFNNEFIRMQKMRRKRNNWEYDNLDNVSKSELAQAVKDTEKVMNAVEKIISEEELQEPML